MFNGAAFEIKKSNYIFKQVENQNKEIWSISGNFMKIINSELVIKPSVYIEKNQAKTKSQSSDYISTSLDVEMFMPKTGIKTVLSVLGGRRNFKQKDEFFMKKRNDQLQRVKIEIIPYRLNIGKYYPSLEIVSEKNNSNIEFYTGERTRISLTYGRGF